MGERTDARQSIESSARHMTEIAQARVVLPVARDEGDAGGQAIRLAAAVEDGDLVAALLERLEQMQADELGAAHDEHAHDGGDSIRASRSA